MKSNYVIQFLVIIALAVQAGCTTIDKEAKSMQLDASNGATQAPLPAPPPIVTNISGAWLMGQPIKVLPPVPPILTGPIAYRGAQKVSLSDMTAYITSETGLLIDIAEVQSNSASNTQGSGTPGSSGVMTPPAPPTSPIIGPTSLLNIGGSGSLSSASQGPQLMSINYKGTVSGLLDVLANKTGVWWKYVDDKVVFYRTETKTFYLPTNSRKSSGGSTITTSSTSSSSGSTTGSSGMSPTSGATIVSDYAVDVWGDMEKTAKAVGSGAQVVANASTGSLTVTGTPKQVRDIEEWIKGLTEQLSQQVVITLHMYSVKMKNENTYNWDPSIVFKKAVGTYGYTLTPTTPFVPLSGATPVGLGMSVLSGAPNAWGQYSGTQAAFQALSTMGSVSEKLQQTIITLNGQPAPIQMANQQGYLASSSTTTSANVGTTATETPGTVTTGFTATFLPRVVNGKIILNMTMTNSSLISLTTVGPVGSPIQTPNVDLATFQQSVSLTPGDAILLTGLQQDSSNSNNSGVGSPTNAAFGGGMNSNTNKSMIAIVISAKVL